MVMMVDDDRPQAAADFEFVAGALCLDFTNTVGGRRRPEPREHLRAFSDLVAWFEQASLLDTIGANTLRAWAEQHPGAADALLRRARALREAIHAVFQDVAHARPPQPAALALLNREVQRLLARSRLEPRDDGDGFGWAWDGDPAAPERPLWSVVRSAADLLTSDHLDQVRGCGQQTCAWLFLDTTRNRSRRWCSMADCGNRAKAQRHYRRRRASAESPRG